MAGRRDVRDVRRRRGFAQRAMLCVTKSFAYYTILCGSHGDERRRRRRHELQTMHGIIIIACYTQRPRIGTGREKCLSRCFNAFVFVSG